MFLTLYRNNNFRFWCNRAGYAMRFIGNQTCRSIDALACGIGVSVSAVVGVELLTQLLLSIKFLENEKHARHDYPILFLNCLFAVIAHRFKETKLFYNTSDTFESSDNHMILINKP